MSSQKLLPSFSVFDAETVKVPSGTFEGTQELEEEVYNEVILHFMVMQEIFLRLSWENKMTLFKKLVNEMDDLEAICLLLYNIQSVIDGKSIMYCEVMHDCNYLFDRAIKDHNRTIDLKTYQKSEEEEIQWFRKLIPTNQVMVIDGLMRIGGGMTIRKIYPYVLKLYREKFQKQEEKILEATKSLEIQKQSKVTANETPQQKKGKKRAGVELPDDEIVTDRDFRTELQGNPETRQQLEQARKQWKAKIDKYRREVEAKPKEKKEKKKKGKKGGSKKSKTGKKGQKDKKSSSARSKKSKDKSKNTKKSKKGGKSSSKSSKGKKKRSKEDDVLDYIQILPVWLVMKIFAYLDEKTLKKVRKVHPYWDFVVDLVKEDKKARKALDKLIKKLETEIGDVSLEDDGKQPEEYYKLTETEKRTFKMMRKGASDKRILGEIPSKHQEVSAIYTTAVNEWKEHYVLPVQLLEMYPRLQTGTLPPVYKAPFFCLRDINLRFEEDENLLLPDDPTTVDIKVKNSKVFNLPEDQNKRTPVDFNYAELESW